MKEDNEQGICRKCKKDMYIHDIYPPVGDSMHGGDFCDNESCEMYRILIAQ